MDNADIVMALNSYGIKVKKSGRIWILTHPGSNKQTIGTCLKKIYTNVKKTLSTNTP